MHKVVMNIVYSQPICKDTAVCMCFFSPANYERPKQNFLHVYHMLLKAKIPTFTAECVIGDASPLIAEPTIRVKSNSYLFYKEQLYNLLVERIPEQYTKLIFIDSDIIFSDKNWIDRISRALNMYDVIQPFQTAVWLSIYYNSFLEKKNSYLFRLQQSPYPSISDLTLCHQGFSYAMTRNFYNQIGGFFDKCIIGGGDTGFGMIFYKERLVYPYAKAIAKEYDEWVEKVRLIPKKFTYLPLTVYHLYHGSAYDRKYDKRHTILENIDNSNWDDLVYKNEDGVYELKSKEANEIMKNYFISRNEDSLPSIRFNWQNINR